MQGRAFTCLVHSVISTGVVPAPFSYFIAVCSLLFSFYPVILDGFGPSFFFSILPWRGEGGRKGREVSERRGLEPFSGNNKLQNTIPKPRQRRNGGKVPFNVKLCFHSDFSQGFFWFYLVKQRVLERHSHRLPLGGEGKLRLIVTEPETALAIKEETFEEKSVPTKVNKSCNPNQSFEIVGRVSNLSLIFGFHFILGFGCHEQP